MKDPRYPIGKYTPQPYSEAQKNSWLSELAALPIGLEKTVANLSDADLDIPYRAGGWTNRQLIHHISDSHLNAYTRFKLGMTEDNPTVKAYDENKWVLLEDTTTVPIKTSVDLLKNIHQRWVAAIKNLSEKDWQKTVVHSETKQTLSLWHLLGMYAWHGKHHKAHIDEYLKNKS